VIQCYNLAPRAPFPLTWIAGRSGQERPAISAGAVSLYAGTEAQGYSVLNKKKHFNLWTVSLNLHSIHTPYMYLRLLFDTSDTSENCWYWNQSAETHKNYVICLGQAWRSRHWTQVSILVRALFRVQIRLGFGLNCVRGNCGIWIRNQRGESANGTVPVATLEI